MYFLWKMAQRRTWAHNTTRRVTITGVNFFLYKFIIQPITFVIQHTKSFNFCSYKQILLVELLQILCYSYCAYSYNQIIIQPIHLVIKHIRAVLRSELAG